MMQEGIWEKCVVEDGFIILNPQQQQLDNGFSCCHTRDSNHHRHPVHCTSCLNESGVGCLCHWDQILALMLSLEMEGRNETTNEWTKSDNNNSCVPVTCVATEGKRERDVTERCEPTTCVSCSLFYRVVTLISLRLCPICCVRNRVYVEECGTITDCHSLSFHSFLCLSCVSCV